MTPERIVSNLEETLNFELAPEDMAALNDIGFSQRYCDPSRTWSLRVFPDSPALEEEQ